MSKHQWKNTSQVLLVGSVHMRLYFLIFFLPAFIVTWVIPIIPSNVIDSRNSILSILLGDRLLWILITWAMMTSFFGLWYAWWNRVLSSSDHDVKNLYSWYSCLARIVQTLFSQFCHQFTLLSRFSSTSHA